MMRSIDKALLDELSDAAKAGARRRQNRNFHRDDGQPAHRLLNAIEPGSYVMPHRHLDPAKDETMVVLRGRLGLVEFADDGRVLQASVLGPGLDALGVDIPHGTWHTVFALEPGTVFFEAKAGPYLPLADDEKAPWAPAEGMPAAVAYQARLAALLS